METLYHTAIFLTLYTGGVETTQAHRFLNEQNCWQWVYLFNAGLQPDMQWLGRCMPMDEFRRKYPTLRFEGDS
jgi:hypothetical protein